MSQSIQDIIQSGFDISTTTLPKDRLHKVGGMYEKKVADGFEVLEISKVHGLKLFLQNLSLKQKSPVLNLEQTTLANTILTKMTTRICQRLMKSMTMTMMMTHSTKIS